MIKVKLDVLYSQINNGYMMPMRSVKYVSSRLNEKEIDI